MKLRVGVCRGAVPFSCFGRESGLCVRSRGITGSMAGNTDKGRDLAMFNVLRFGLVEAKGLVLPCAIHVEECVEAAPASEPSRVGIVIACEGFFPTFKVLSISI